MRAIANIDSKSVNSTLTRRAALTGIACVAMPATAAAVCIPAGFEGPEPIGSDPIFPAIEAYKRGFAFHLECLRKADPIEAACWRERDAMDAMLEKNREKAVPPFLATLRETDPGATPDEAFEMLKAIGREMVERRSNMPECYRLRAEGSDAECDATDAMLATVPTSTAGALALVELVLGESEEEQTTLGDMFAQDESVTTLLKSMACFLRGQA